jgi:hypothetical protein
MTTGRWNFCRYSVATLAEHHRLRIVAVDVEDQCLDHLGDVGGDRGDERE